VGRGSRGRRELRAGPLSLTFLDGWLRWIRLGDQELVRAIYAAVRDDSWGTAPGVLEPLAVEAGATSFWVRFTSRHRAGPIDFVWNGELSGTEAGVIRFVMDGVARSSFESNRVGICVLHPASIGGSAVRIDTAHGSQESAFPRLIAPDQPFTDIRSMRWTVEPGVDAVLSFEGDSFETEDQRNWTDASFKTFSRPLRHPHPVHIAAGDRVRQSATLALEGPPPRSRGRHVPTHDAPSVHMLGTTRPAPAFGIALAPGRERLGRDEIAALHALAPTSTRVTLELDRPGWADTLRAAESVVDSLGGSLEVEAVLDDPTSLSELVEGANDRTRASADIFVFTAAGFASDVALIRRLHELRSARHHEFRIGGGSRADFAQLNRTALPFDLLDVVGFPVSAQVHAFDDVSVMETLEAHPAAIESARAIAGRLPLTVGPVTLRPRFSAYGTSRPTLGRASDEGRRDDRQQADFAAAWTIGALMMAEAGAVERIVLHEATGPAGVLGSPGPGLASSPLYVALRALAGGTTAHRVERRGRDVAAVARSSGKGVRIVVANLSGALQEVDVHLPAEPAGVSVTGLDGTEAEAERRRDAFRVHLDPYGVGVLRSEAIT
jgi:hypothetical protein